MAKKKEEPNWASRFPGGREVEGDGTWFTWDHPGQELVGVFMGTERFRNGWKTTINTDDGLIVFSTPSLLKPKLAALEIGERVAIVYIGDSDRETAGTRKGNPLKEFKVFMMGSK